MTGRTGHAAAGTSKGTFRRRAASLVPLVLVMVAGLLTACAATEIPHPPTSAAPAPRLPLISVLAAVRRAPAMRALPPGLTPSLAAAALDIGFDSDRCEAAPAATRIDACVFGDPAASTRVVLLGDSHAGMWLPPLIDIAQRRHWQLRFFGKPGCPAPDITVRNGRTGRADTGCDRFRAFAERSIRADRPGLVLVADQSYDQRTGPGRTVTAGAWQGGLRRTLASLRRSGARVIVIGDTPVLDRSGPECLAAHPRNIAACSPRRPPRPGASGTAPTRRPPARPARVTSPCCRGCAA